MSDAIAGKAGAAGKAGTAGRRRKGRRGAGKAEEAVQPGELDLGMLTELSGYLVRRAQLAIWQDFLRGFAGTGITPAQFSALVVIGANPGVIQTVLANALAIERSAMVPLIDHLEELGLAIRVPSASDRRSRALHLTARGAAVLRDLERLVREHEARVTAALTPAEHEALLALLRKMMGG